MTKRQLQKQHAHAFKMKRLTRMRGWEKALARLNLEIMRRSKPIRGVGAGAPPIASNGQAH